MYWFRAATSRHVYFPLRQRQNCVNMRLQSTAGHCQSSMMRHPSASYRRHRRWTISPFLAALYCPAVRLPILPQPYRSAFLRRVARPAVHPAP
jgi:hypothetical protein